MNAVESTGHSRSLSKEFLCGFGQGHESDSSTHSISVRSLKIEGENRR